MEALFVDQSVSLIMCVSIQVINNIIPATCSVLVNNDHLCSKYNLIGIFNHINCCNLILFTRRLL